MNAADLLRPDLDALPDYTPAHVPDPRRVIKLDSNENPFGPSPRALAALGSTDTWHYYVGQDELRTRLASYTGLTEEHIVVTNGGDEAIDLALRAVLEPGDAVIDAPPSFEMYRISTLANRGRVVDVPRAGDFGLDLEAVKRAVVAQKAKAVVVASPNNPDGNLLPRAALLELLQLPLLVLLDEAYFEFAGETAAGLIAAHPNLALVRTFSKWAGLAGLRVGYVLAAPELARALHRLRAPYNVNLAGVVAACESLADADYLLGKVQLLCAERERMSAAYAALGWLEPLPSYTNFVTMRVQGHSPHAVKAALAGKNILIRAFRSARLADYMRISVGTPEQNDAVLAALRQIG